MGCHRAEVFTPLAGEVEWARGKTQDDQHFLALLGWLQAYQRLGYFPKLRRLSAGISGSGLGLLRLLVVRDVMAPTSHSSSQPLVMISGYDDGAPGPR